MTGQQDAEYRAGGPALARIFHHAAMIGHQLGDESKAKPASLWLAGDERLEQMIDDIGGRARSGIDQAHLDRERQPPPSRSGPANTGTIGGGDRHLGTASPQADSFRPLIPTAGEYKET